VILCKEDITNLSMSWVEFRAHKRDLPLISLPPGRHSYRLLTYIGLSYHNIKIADIGSRRGASAYSLACNPNNMVFTYDTNPHFDIMSDVNRPKNVIFSTFNCIHNTERVLDCHIIFLDVAPHNGTKELKFLNGLEMYRWKGILILDDIHLNKQMKEFWSNIIQPKYDITEYGHGSGTGLVNFSTEEIILT
jgi:hypothetical protein